MEEVIRQRYRFNSAQLGFQKQIKAETTIQRHIYNPPKLEFTGLLDLKEAYD